MIETKHACIELSFALSKTVASKSPKEKALHKSIPVAQYKWNEDVSDIFYERVGSDYVANIIKEAIALVDIDFNQALSKFNECLLYVGDCMKNTFIFGGEKLKSWFDSECRLKRKNLRKLLRTFFQNDSDPDKLRCIQDKRVQGIIED